MTTPTPCGFNQLRKRRFAVFFSGATLAACSVCANGATTPISVSITNKITTIHAGAAPVTLVASVKNDPKNAGVKWSLTAGGVTCSPGCGILSGATATTVKYTPPPALPAAPKNAPTLTARSVSDTTKSDSDAFKISAAPAISVTIVN